MPKLSAHNRRLQRAARERRDAMRALRRVGHSYATIGRAYGISRQRVHAIVTGLDARKK